MISCAASLSALGTRSPRWSGENDLFRGKHSYPVSHSFVASLPLVPHPQQCWMTSVNEIYNPHVGLADVLPVQSPGVLLKRALPRYRHCQNQRVEWWVVKTLTDQFTCG